ncbi:uncharacterized protein LOC126392948 isoform X3 [Epinephelus moara]|uniref:uncharacterized protein LOC126392948 isoform X3 n=1 Tax=Epinephelus moara TaxID=300413 RepID=UPI00214E6F13|nr:uncharacterized protein LOC126392948 isoform X3 [Epinephelus moara]
MRHALHTFKQYFITYKPIYKTSQRLSATEPRAPFSTSGLQVSETSPFLWDWEWILFSYTCIHRLLRCRTVRDCDGGEDGILSASSRPAEPVISEVEIHRASSNRPRPWSSSHRITAVGPGPQPEQQVFSLSISDLNECVNTHSNTTTQPFHITVSEMKQEKNTTSPQGSFLLKFMRPLCTTDVLLWQE